MTKYYLIALSWLTLFSGFVIARDKPVTVELAPTETMLVCKTAREGSGCELNVTLEEAYENFGGKVERLLGLQFGADSHSSEMRELAKYAYGYAKEHKDLQDSSRNELRRIKREDTLKVAIAYPRLVAIMHGKSARITQITLSQKQTILQIQVP